MLMRRICLHSLMLAGDGDLGVNMEQGFKAVAEAVETEQPESLQETFFVSAVAINSAAPSTLGTILSVAMQSFSNDCTGLTDIDQARFAEMLHHASDQMTGMGGAKKGGQDHTGQPVSLCGVSDRA